MYVPSVTQSKNPEKDIDKYYEKARSYFIGLGYNNDVAIGMANSIKSELGKYEERRNAMFDLFSDYLLKCLE